MKRREANKIVKNKKKFCVHLRWCFRFSNLIYFLEFLLWYWSWYFHIHLFILARKRTRRRKDQGTRTAWAVGTGIDSATYWRCKIVWWKHKLFVNVTFFLVWRYCKFSRFGKTWNDELGGRDGESYRTVHA